MIAAGVGFGGNLKGTESAFGLAFDALASHPRIRNVRGSRLWLTEPVGVENQPEFLNAVARLETELGPREMLVLLKSLEDRAGRKPGLRWGPRILDLDLLLWGDAVVAEPGLSVPHLGLGNRTFVLHGLKEVLPGWRHPVTGARPGQMLAALEESPHATRCRAVPGRRLGAAEVGACST